MRTGLLSFSLLAAVTLLAGCGSSNDDGNPKHEEPEECGEDPKVKTVDLDAMGDPAGGVFTIDDALAGLPEGSGPLRAIIATPKGDLTCELFPDKAPNAVANFVGLARGTRAYVDPATFSWKQGNFYDGLTFHRVIPGFMAQGGDPKGDGSGGPGFSLDDEFSDLKHVPGALAYANSGPDTNGSQFYVTEVRTDFLDGKYTVFGLCEPVSVVKQLTGVPRDANDKPEKPLMIESISITRCAVEP